MTADFVYVRLHGAEQLYASGYTDEQLDGWAARIREWRRGCQPADAACVSNLAPAAASGRDVYVYFDNDAKVHAPFDAMRLMERLAQGSKKRLAQRRRVTERRSVRSVPPLPECDVGRKLMTNIGGGDLHDRRAEGQAVDRARGGFSLGPGRAR